MSKLEVGTRVVLITDQEHFPLGIWRAGETGTITSIMDNLNGETGLTYMVKLDRHYPDLAEWDNELQVDELDQAEPSLSSLSIDCLIDEYKDWNKANGLNLGSADEHYLYDETLTQAQHEWLRDFIARWERASQDEHEQAAIERRARDEDRSR